MGEPNSNTANLQDEIFRAAKVGDKELLQSLLNKGQSAYIIDEHGWSPLHYAANGGHSDCTNILLNKGEQNI